MELKPISSSEVSWLRRSRRRNPCQILSNHPLLCNGFAFTHALRKEKMSLNSLPTSENSPNIANSPTHSMICFVIASFAASGMRAFNDVSWQSRIRPLRRVLTWHKRRRQPRKTLQTVAPAAISSTCSRALTP